MMWSNVDSCCWNNKFNVAFYEDRVFVRPINTMSMGALIVIANPVCFESSCVYFRACCGVNPDRLAPFRDTGEARFVAVEFFIRGDFVA